MSKTNQHKKRNTILIGIAVFFVGAVVGLLILSDLYLNGPEYRSMVKKCGTKDLIVGWKIPKDPTPRYDKPADPNYSAPSPQAHYFCTEQDARNAGYLPHYNEDGTRNWDYL